MAQQWHQTEEHWHDRHTAAKKMSFLKGLRENGTVTAGCKIARINRRTAYRWRQDDVDFSDLWDEAKEDAVDVVESTLYELAKSGKNIIATIFYLKGNRAKYKDRMPFDVNAMGKEIEERLRDLRTRRFHGPGLVNITEPPQLQLTDADKEQADG